MLKRFFLFLIVCALVSGSTSIPRAKAASVDINGDGIVNIQDLGILLSNWNTSNAAADINSSGSVDIQDLGILLSSWNTSPSQTLTPTPTATPMPPIDLSAIDFILGPQALVGTHPWPQYDQAQLADAEKWANAYLNDSPGGSDYYDLALNLYQLHVRTGDNKWRDLALQVALKAWEGMPNHTDWTATPNEFGLAPRSVPFAGLTLLALSEVPAPTLTFTNANDPSWAETYTLWEWLAGYADRQNYSWLERWETTDDGIHVGIRDGGMLLNYLAILAKVHPDPTVRAQMYDHALTAARDYYADEQLANGSWVWGTDSLTQPFQVGLLLEGLISTHQLTNDPDVRRAILLGTEAMWRDQIDHNLVPFDLLPGKMVEGAFYTVYDPGCEPIIPPQAPCGNIFDPDAGSWVARNKLRVIRHRNTLMAHAFGYAYHITNDARYKNWGDALFEATFGDPDIPVLTSKGKEYNQQFRSSGRYLGWTN